MGDNLKQVGKQIGKTQREIEFLKRRGGLLPSVERTRGIVTDAVSLIAPFTVNEASRKLALSLNFYEKVGGGGCEFGDIEDYVFCELSWGVPYPYGSDVGEAQLWYGEADYPADGFNYPGGAGNTQGPQNFISNTGEFSLGLGGVMSSRPGFYLIRHHTAPTGVSVSANAGYVNNVKVNGTLKSQRVYNVANGQVFPPLATATIQHGEDPSCSACTYITAVVNLTSASDRITFHLSTTGVAFFTDPNFAGSPPHTTIQLIGDPN